MLNRDGRAWLLREAPASQGMHAAAAALPLTHTQPPKRWKWFSPKTQQFSSQIQGFFSTGLQRGPRCWGMDGQGLGRLSLCFPMGCCFLLSQGCASCQPWNAMHSLFPNGNGKFGPNLVLLGKRLWILIGAVERGECSPRGNC